MVEDDAEQIPRYEETLGQLIEEGYLCLEPVELMRAAMERAGLPWSLGVPPRH